MRKYLLVSLLCAVMFLPSGCLTDPVLQQRVDESFQKAAEAGERMERIKGSITQLYGDYQAGKISAETALPKIEELYVELSAAKGDAEAAYKAAQEAQQYARENGTPWWKIAGSVVLGAMGAGGVLARTYGGKIAEWQQKYGGAMDGVRRLVGLTESNPTTQDVKIAAEKLQDPYIEAAVLDMQRSVAASTVRAAPAAAANLQPTA